MPDALWPPFLTPLPELLPWLEQEAKRRAPEGIDVFRHLTSLRWLVLAELDRPAVPEPPKPS